MSETVVKTGKVTNITSEVKPKQGGGTFTVHNLFVDGSRYGCGYSKKVITDAGVKIGDTVKLSLVKKGDFWNVDSIEKVAEVVQVAVVSAVPQSQVEVPTRTGSVQIQIVRQSVLKIASDLVNGFANHPSRKSSMTLDTRLGKIVAFADHLVKYVETGVLEVVNKADVEKIEKELEEGE